MKKEELKKIALIIIPMIFIIVFLITRGTFLYGSTTDWYNQHIAFADYFRKSFYESGNLLPNLALSIGSGQNIFHFSYYGFLSPYTLLSYLFPFLSVETFYSILNIIIVIVSGLLFYSWFRDTHTKKQTFLATILFTLATPLLFHTHRHFMFMNYMPFVILGLMGVDHYMKKKKTWMIILSIFLITMTSFYYALPSGLCFFLYYLYLKQKQHEKFFIKKDFIFIGSIALGALMASIITFPTLYAILNSRGSASLGNLLSLILPSFSFEDFTISSYGLGLTAIFLYALMLNLKSEKKEIRFLTIAIIALTIFPIFTFVLNGFLYARAKILIPLLPICLILISEFIRSLEENKICIKDVIIALLLLIILSLVFTTNILFILFLAAETIAIIYYLYEKDTKIFYLALMIVALAVNIGTNFNDTLLSNQEKQEIEDTRALITDIKDPNFYRINLLANEKYNTNYVHDTSHLSTSVYSSVYHHSYTDFLKNTSFSAWNDQCILVLNQSNNILLQSYLGVKYVISQYDHIPVGYEKIAPNIYKNSNVLPIIYASSNLVSKDDYLKLNNKEKMETLLNYVVVDEGTNQYPETHVIKKELQVKEVKPSPNVSITYEQNKLTILSQGSGTIDIVLEEPTQDEIFFLEFDILNQKACQEGGLSIKINDITNLLSCKGYLYYNNNTHFQYPLSSNQKTDTLHVTLEDGLYEIANIEVHTLAYQHIINQTIDSFVPESISSDRITGHINVSKDGYLVVNIPYDKGFTIKLNHETVDYKQVNEAFMGIKVKQGYYHLEITYQSPFLKIGIMISLISFLIFAFICYKESRGN